MNNNYYMNILTGELLTPEQAIHQYYTEEKHTYKDNWLDVWTPTELIADNSEITAESICNCFLTSVNI